MAAVFSDVKKITSFQRVVNALMHRVMFQYLRFPYQSVLTKTITRKVQKLQIRIVLQMILLFHLRKKYFAVNPQNGN